MIENDNKKPEEMEWVYIGTHGSDSMDDSNEETHTDESYSGNNKGEGGIRNNLKKDKVKIAIIVGFIVFLSIAIMYSNATDENKILEKNAKNYNISVAEYLQLKDCLTGTSESVNICRRWYNGTGKERQERIEKEQRRQFVIDSVYAESRRKDDSIKVAHERIQQKKMECFKRDSIRIVENNGACFAACDSKFPISAYGKIGTIAKIMSTENEDRKNHIKHTFINHEKCDEKCSDKIQTRLEESRTKCFQ